MNKDSKEKVHIKNLQVIVDSEANKGVVKVYHFGNVLNNDLQKNMLVQNVNDILYVDIV